MANTKKHGLDFFSVWFAVSHSSGYGQIIERYIKASNGGEFTAGNVDRCKIALDHVDLRDEKLNIEQLQKQLFDPCLSHSKRIEVELIKFS